MPLWFKALHRKQLTIRCLHTSDHGGSLCAFTFRDGERGTPLRAQDVQTDAAVTVDVGMVDFCGEGNLTENQNESRNSLKRLIKKLFITIQKSVLQRTRI